MVDHKNEEWRPIKGYEGLYEVSNLGNVRSLDRYIETEKGKRFIKGKMRKSFISHAGYRMLSLCSKKYLVHRLVADAFCENTDSERFNVVDHINTDTLDNRAENLRWCDTAGNLANPISRNRRIEGIRRSITPESFEKSRKTRATNIANRPYDYIMGIGRNGEPLYFRSVKEAAEYLNIPSISLREIMNGKYPVRDDFKIWFKGKENLLREKKPKKIVYYPPVIQLDENKKPIRSFKSCSAAAEELGGYTGENIRIAAKKGGKAYGYYWKFSDDTKKFCR